MSVPLSFGKFIKINNMGRRARIVRINFDIDNQSVKIVTDKDREYQIKVGDKNVKVHNFGDTTYEVYRIALTPYNLVSIYLNSGQFDNWDWDRSISPEQLVLSSVKLIRDGRRKKRFHNDTN